MRNYTSIHLRWWLPIIMLSALAVSMATSSVWRYQYQTAKLEQQTDQQIRARMARLQHRIETLQRLNQDELVGEEIFDFGNDLDVNSLALIDDHGQILHATKRIWSGKAITDVMPEFDNRRFIDLQHHPLLSINFDTRRNRLFAYQPLVLEARPGEIRPSRVGMLLLDYSLASAKTDIRQELWTQAIGNLIISALVMLLLVLALYHWVSSPLSEANLRAMLDNSPYLVWLKDPNGRYIKVNQVFADYLKLDDPKQAEGKTDFDLNPKELAEKYRADDLEVMASRKPKHVEETTFDGDEAHWVETFKTPIIDRYGNVLGTVGFASSITERKRSEIALQESETRFRTVIEQSPIGMAFGRDGLTVEVNKVYLDMFGFDDMAEVCGHPLVNQIAPQCRPEIAEKIRRRSLGEQIETSYETVGLRKDGSQFPLYISAKRVLLTEGPLTFAFLIDITERQQSLNQLSLAADELVRANIQIEEERARLADRVQERTTQLLFANHAKDSFLATMSHEIRTPLGGLLGMMELLSLSQLGPEQNDILKAAQLSGKSLLRIVNDILDWSKIEAGKLELAPRNATIADMLKSVASTYAQIAAEKDMPLQFEIDPALSAAHLFDQLRVSQILNNFTSNAIKFTERGSVKLSARRLARHNGSETVRFSVQDSGTGISPEQQQRLFQPYEQASAETAQMYGGTGLGLSICLKLAELMGGTLSVESTPGVGSTFSFTVSLPVTSQAIPDPLRQDGERYADGNEIPDIKTLGTAGQQISVLIADDHPLNRMLLKQQLGLLGIQVDTAEDGKIALSLWQKQNRHYDLVITDCHMPEMDGYELTYRIRDLEQHAGAQRIPIIAWTANVLAEEEERCHAAGMDDLLTKPTELADLRAMLVKWFINTGVLANTP